MNTGVSTVTANSLHLSGSLMVAAAVVLFLAAHVNDNYSWVDRSWSILPVVYTWIQIYYTHHEHGGTPTNTSFSAGVSPISAAALYGFVITVWGCRLTFNFFRRGGYSRGSEDYRWNYVRTWRVFAHHPAIWTLFNFAAISLFQTWLLWAITLPVMQFSAAPATAKEVVFAAVMLALIVLEAVCDEQQWRFHQAKGRALGQSPYCYGFCVTGVFGYSRHLNVFCEGGIWVMLAVAAQCCGAGSLASWQWIGCVVLEALTLFSTAVITEKLSAEKYAGYAIYQSITPMLLPAISSTTDEVLFQLESKRIWKSDEKRSPQK
ncbi:hypothetical protein ABB37_04310 [Leptomonas pyrrhocoris]|uniref:Steroid 5-alpha reductase C-terminal domain-containing protein n=1 Tax=Leptomonas pyrrhocoris TaxID=157538 RepID=A0A0M9G2N3_LEPPY|nr:hypothetical protein ABB37_04310 [Leptomonas pyrrhocoris]XP_015659346.1 hypothetical protein ABB37_04310 [Leptomonas pyrrhocoris]KPA80906.1 hypothetical protein ABB37_04310 [Leptomonas pyrrhocoris]KPA80907.1 hypothetical protein ABB37_04310 [Leptomonas pyrrhocoris]|eukprot:XP_015659345.1 hypothetical protein ABB37_04310 [Leptomonas pyrrhocoris]